MSWVSCHISEAPLMKTHVIYVNFADTVTLACEDCHRSKTLPAAAVKDLPQPIKVRRPFWGHGHRPCLLSEKNAAARDLYSTRPPDGPGASARSADRGGYLTHWAGVAPAGIPCHPR